MTTLTNNQNEQLFTELTPEEAAVVEGGALKLLRLHAINLEDGDGTDEIVLPNKIGNKRKTNPIAMSQGRKNKQS